METNDYLERLELRATVPTIRRVPAGRPPHSTCVGGVAAGHAAPAAVSARRC